MAQAVARREEWEEVCAPHTGGRKRVEVAVGVEVVAGEGVGRGSPLHTATTTPRQAAALLAAAAAALRAAWL